MRKDLWAGEIQCVADVEALLGESPVWDPRDNKLYWSDIKGRRIFRFDPSNEAWQVFESSAMISAMALHNDGGFVAANENGFCTLRIEAGKVQIEPIADPERHLPNNRFNDGKADPKGGFWAGTMDNREEDVTGQWWRLSPGGSISRLSSGFKVTNGPAFDALSGRVFLTDSAKQTVFSAASDGVQLGELEPFLQFLPGDGYPDGMELDSQGCLWIAFWDGWCIRRFSPSGELLQDFNLPVPRPTSIAIAANGLFVTSARIGLEPSEIDTAPLSGGLFFIPLSQDIGRVQPTFAPR